jgi:hypothetical protein
MSGGAPVSRKNNSTLYAHAFAARLERGEKATRQDIDWLWAFRQGRSKERQANGYTAYIEGRARRWAACAERLVAAPKGKFWETHDAIWHEEGKDEDDFDDFINLTPPRNWQDVRKCLNDPAVQICTASSFADLMHQLQTRFDSEE